MDADVEGTLVRVKNRATGYFAEARVHRGVYLIPGLETGGPYTIDVRRFGYASQQLDGVFLALGERRELDFTLGAVASRLDTVRVNAEDNRPPRAAGGVGTAISDSTLRRLPTLNGDLYDFLRMVPQAGTRFGPSGAGANFRLNNYQIDGVSDRNLQGNGTPGGGTNGTKSISLDAVKEYQVLLSPFDARYGDFTGLLVNAVTKSGTNDVQGSAYAYLRNAQLARSGSLLGNSAYDRELYGLSLGGPIIRNRMHFFIAPEIQRAAAPARGPFIGQSADATPRVPVSPDSVVRFAALLRDKGIDAGDGGRVMLPNPNVSFFGRVDVALPEMNSRLVLRENYGQSEQSQLQRETTNLFQLSSVAATTRTAKQTTAVHLFSQLSTAVFNEFQMSYTDNPILGVPGARSPSIQVSVGSATGKATLLAGPGPGNQGSGSRAVSVEVGDHLVFQPGSSHTLGFGAHVEFFRYHITGMRNSFGVWIFPNLDALAVGAASQYAIGKDYGSAEAPVVGTEPSVYLTDDWRLSNSLTLTLGLRATGLTFSERPAYNPVVDALFQRRTSDFPSFHAQWSPRFGFVWNPDADQRMRIHGGAGIFAGRPPLGWLVGPMRSNGAGVQTLTCNGGAKVPPFAPYPAPQPSTCADSSGPTNGAVTLVDPNLRMAESFRTSLAVERRLPWNVSASVEALYSKVRSDFVFSNVNLQGPVDVDPHGRVMYGTFDALGVATPSLVKGSTFTEVIDLRNQSGGYSWSVTGQIHKPWSDDLEMHVSYTYSRVRDVQSVTSGAVGSPLDIWAGERPVSGRRDEQSTGISAFEIPHRVVLSATYVARWKHRTTDISLFYVGESGAPFTFGDSTAASGKSGDLNADGTAADDPIYVPRNATDPSEIVFAGTDSSVRSQGAAFEQFIRDTPCLDRQRGRIVARNSCHGSWVNTSNLSVRQSLPAIGGHAASMQLEVFNVLNLLNSSWGLFAVPNPWILQYAGQTTGANPQPKFTFDPTNIRSLRNAESGYQLQLSLRYSF